MKWTTCKAVASSLRADETGQDLVEYALIAVLIALGSVMALKSVSTNVKTVFTGVATTLTTAL